MLLDIQGKTILVTGGTGSIGSEIVRQLISLKPQAIRVFSRGEIGHYPFPNQLQHKQAKTSDDEWNLQFLDARINVDSIRRQNFVPRCATIRSDTQLI